MKKWKGRKQKRNKVHKHTYINRQLYTYKKTKDTMIDAALGEGARSGI